VIEYSKEPSYMGKLKKLNINILLFNRRSRNNLSQRHQTKKKNFGDYSTKGEYIGLNKTVQFPETPQ